ncbi:MAG: DUF6985 domain-containing protein [Chloroflexia bacterium]
MEPEITGDELNIPPLPPLRWNDYYWVATIVLTSWAGFRSRQGRFSSIDESVTSDGSVNLMIRTPDRKQSTPSAEQVAAYQQLIEQQESIRETPLEAIFAQYPTWREEYIEDYGEEEAEEEIEEVVPDIQRPEQLKELIGLSTVHIHTHAKDGLAYVGYQFGANWDDEHGLGVMTHAGRVVDIGQADTSVLEWIAEEDDEDGE